MKSYLQEYYKEYESLTEEEKLNTDYLNCCEITLLAANDTYHLNLNFQALKMAKCFGGGMGVESVCGIVTGSIMILGIIFFDRENHREIAQEYIKAFENLKQSIQCNDLKINYSDENTGCRNLIIDSSEILQEIIEKHL